MYELFEDAAAFRLGGLTVYVYGLFVALGALSALLTLWAREKRLGLPSGSAALVTALALPFGFVLARGVYCLMDTNFQVVSSLKAALLLSGGGYAMSGALLGAVLAALLGAKIMKVKPGAALDALAPALLLFLMFARAGEGFTALGISRPLRDEVLKNTFLSRADDYDAYLNTFILESAAALILFFVSLALGKRETRPGHTALKTGLLFAASQVLFESLRYDQHLKYGFVGVQHVLSMVFLCAIVIALSTRALQAKKARALPVFSLAFLPVLVGLLILIEFWIDRTDISRWLLYGAYILLLIVPVACGFQLDKGEKK